jgi:hypothetical protein
MNKTGSHLNTFFLKNYLIVALNLYRPFVAAKSTTLIFFIFRSNKFRVSTIGVVYCLSPPGVTSLPTDIATPSRHVTLPSHEVKMSSLSPLRLSVTFRLVVSPLEPNRSNESAPSPPATLLEPADSRPPLL